MKVVQIGCGKMSLYTMRYVLEKKGKIVGAFDISEKVIGKDVAEILGVNGKIAVVEDIKKLDERLKALKPDIAIITTIAAIVFIVIGIMKGEHSIVLEKAINICLQCIGIG